jgi:hypothetical protein
MLGRLVRLAWSFVVAASLASALACAPDVHEKPRTPPCPAPPEPAHQSVVVGTIGKLHMVESGYALARFGDVIAAFKPDLVLVGARVDPFREDRLEDASFEMTYIVHLAKARGIPVEPIDWFREADLSAARAPVEPFDVVEIEKRETEVLRAPKLYTFEQANSDALSAHVLLATSAAARHRGGDPLAARRRAWLSHLTIEAAERHSKPKRVLAFVDVFDRPIIDAALHTAGYYARSPGDVVATSKEVLAGGDVPSDLMSVYQAQLARAKERALKAGDAGAEKSFWEDRARVLAVVIEKTAACCVTQRMLEPHGP